MIIRRRHTADFTTISNKLRDDKRLEADEVGILYYLLTQPQDWEVRLPALRKRWRFGPDRMKRIVWNWMRTGWLKAEKIRLEGTGHFQINYEVQDEPGPGLTDAEIRQALSVVSTESETDEDASLAAGPGGDEPGVDDQGVETGGVAHIESTKNYLQNTIPTKAPPVWRDIRAAWPSTDILSPEVAEKLFAALSPDDRQRALEGVGPYLLNCRAKNRKLCDLATYLREKRFNGDMAITPTTFAVHGNTAEAFRWLQYKRAIGDRTEFMETLWKQKKPWYAPMQWPPPIPAKPDSAKAS